MPTWPERLNVLLAGGLDPPPWRYTVLPASALLTTFIVPPLMFRAAPGCGALRVDQLAGSEARLVPPPTHVCAAGAGSLPSPEVDTPAWLVTAGVFEGSGAEAIAAEGTAGGGAEGVHVDWFQIYHWWVVASCP